MKYNIRRKKQLEIALQRIPSHPFPNIEFEQYLTPAHIAADVLWNAYSLGDIEGKKIVDLGCGTGIFAIGSLILGAKESVGVDIDQKALETARLEAQHFKVDDKIQFINSDVGDLSFSADTVIQNPPFGAQRAMRKNIDRKFMQKSLEIASTVYSFHMKETEEFVINYFNSLGGHLTHKFYYKFVIPRTYHFHEKEKINIDVVLVRIKKN